ncbi:H-NS histone family protein [Thermomonas sp.]|uniref:H-NS histone family protein n=1 Tax=Thermomonas sp. TaxID=1971895 RepID=UPI00248906F3|nr:H-NS histone family protein [Thermomonas sp.]MDI1254222.1 H-NS histone family protein [Thermomonas sp.]
MSMDIEGLSTKELADLITRANKRKKILSKRRPATQVKTAVAKFLKSTGWDFEELYGLTGPSKPAAAAATSSPAPAAKKARKSTKGRSLGKVPPKYRNTANAKETWAGRGKQPRWLSAETAKGRKLEEFLIK